MPNPHAHLHVVHRVVAGSQHANALPAAPENRPLLRVWTLLNAEKLAELGPVHQQSAFLEDQTHDWRIRNGCLHYYSRLVDRGAEVDVVLDFETELELAERLGRAPANGVRPRRQAKSV